VLDDLVDVIRRRLQHAQAYDALLRLLDTSDEKAVAELAARAHWVHLPRGELLMREGDPADCLYVVASGRLQAFVRGTDGNDTILGQMGRGETVGEMALAGDCRRSAHVKALRDCDLARLDRDDFVEVGKRHPEIMVDFVRRFIERSLADRSNTNTELGALRIFAIVPASPRVPVRALADELAEEMSKLGTTRLLDHRSADADLGLDTRHTSVEHSHGVLLSAWLSEQEARHDHLLLVAEGSVTPWSMRCVGQADMILLVADATEDPEPGELEIELLKSVAKAGRAPTALLLFHPSGTAAPNATAQWMATRQLDAHHHLRHGRRDDVARVARLLTGKAIGVVLGGGGARAAAHIGVLRALRDSGIPIDMIGGTSAGAGIAAQYAMGWDDETIIEANIDGFVRNNPFRRPTLPLISLIDRRKMDALARKMFGALQIEDLWIGFFCVSCNLNKGEAEVHRRGSLWRAVRASSALPGISVPVVQDGELLVDGGVVDNLPGQTMRRLMGGQVVVVDVSSDQGMSVDIDYADIPGAWRLLWSRLSPFGKPISFPNMTDVLLRTVTVSSLPAHGRTLAEADLVLNPPVDGFGMMQFSATREIAADAYAYAMERLRETSLPRICDQMETGDTVS